MDTIDTFLDAMFAPYPTTPRLVDAKRELRAMMEDAYVDAVGAGRSHNEAVGQVISDFGNLEELAPALGILPEIRGAQAAQASLAATSRSNDADDAAGAPSTTPPTGAAPPVHPPVTLPEAQQLAQARRETGQALGSGVALCVLAAIPLVSVSSLVELGWLTTNEDLAFALALPLTLALVAAGVLVLVRRHQRFVSLSRLTDGKFTRDPIVTAWARRLRLEHEPVRSRALAYAVGLWILAAIPASSAALVGEATGTGSDGAWSGFGVALGLVLVAAGLRLFLPTTWASATLATLTEEGHPDDACEASDPDGLTGTVASIYWPLVTAIYLGWSFWTMDWDRTWIVWPVAAALFAAIAAITSAMSPRRRTSG